MLIGTVDTFAVVFAQTQANRNRITSLRCAAPGASDHVRKVASIHPVASDAWQRTGGGDVQRAGNDWKNIVFRLYTTHEVQDRHRSALSNHKRHASDRETRAFANASGAFGGNIAFKLETETRRCPGSISVIMNTDATIPCWQDETWISLRTR